MGFVTSMSAVKLKVRIGILAAVLLTTDQMDRIVAGINLSGSATAAGTAAAVGPASTDKIITQAFFADVSATIDGRSAAVSSSSHSSSSAAVLPAR